MKFLHGALLTIVSVCVVQAHILDVPLPGADMECFTEDTIHLRYIGTSSQSISWHSDINGVLGTGTELFWLCTTAGIHTISVKPDGSNVPIASIKLDVWPYDSVNVYIAGAFKSEYQGYAPVIWINDSLMVGSISSTPENMNRQFRQLAIDGDDILALDNAYNITRYWKNLNEIRIPLDSGESGRLTAIYANDGEIIYGGTVKGIDGKQFGRPCVWKDGKRRVYSDTFAVVYSIVKHEGNLYVGVIEDYGSLVVWKNDSCIVRLSHIPGIYKEAENAVALFVHNNELTTIGNAQAIVDGHLIQYGFVWKNGKKQYLTMDLSKNDKDKYPDHTASVVSSHHCNSHIHTVARSNLDLKNYYFKDSLVQIWSDTTVERADIGAVFVHRNHVFLAGGIVKNGVTYTCYWRNWKRYDLSQSTGANAIHVVDRKAKSSSIRQNLIPGKAGGLQMRNTRKLLHLKRPGKKPNASIRHDLQGKIIDPRNDRTAGVRLRARGTEE